jgi:hypothetical protein
MPNKTPSKTESEKKQPETGKNSESHAISDDELDEVSGGVATGGGVGGSDACLTIS